MKVTVENEFWQVFPEGQISVLVVKGLDNRVDESKDPYFKSLLDKGAKRADDFIPDKNFTQNEVIQEWRQAFSKFKTKKGARSSIEALLKRVSQGREFHPINPLVDIYNSVSLSYAVPCGGEDLDKIVGGLYLGKPRVGKPFSHWVLRVTHRHCRKKLSTMMKRELSAVALIGEKPSGLC